MTRGHRAEDLGAVLLPGVLSWDQASHEHNTCSQASSKSLPFSVLFFLGGKIMREARR